MEHLKNFRLRPVRNKYKIRLVFNSHKWHGKDYYREHYFKHIVNWIKENTSGKFYVSQKNNVIYFRYPHEALDLYNRYIKNNKKLNPKHKKIPKFILKEAHFFRRSFFKKS